MEASWSVIHGLLLKGEKPKGFSSMLDRLHEKETDTVSKLTVGCNHFQENQDLLIRCIVQHLGFAGSRPVAACIIYKCLLQWRSFEAERTSVFDQIIQTIGYATEVCHVNFYTMVS